MTEEEKTVIIEALKALAGTKKKLEDLVNQAIANIHQGKIN